MIGSLFSSSTRPRLARFAAPLLLAAALAGCGSAPLATFDLTAPTPAFSPRAGRGQLIISEPSATPPADTDRIVVRTGPSSVAFLKGAQWVDRLTRLVQLRLLHTFENAHLLRSVGRPEDGLTAAHRLTSEIRRFEMDTSTNEAVIEMSAKIVDEGTGRIVAGQVFTARVPGSAADGVSATTALDAALAKIMVEIVQWAAPKA